MSQDNQQTLYDFLSRMPNASTLEVFSHEKACGVAIRFSESGLGFGEITLAVDMETGEPRIDTEMMSPQACARILMRLVGTRVEEAPVSLDPEEQALHERIRRIRQDDFLFRRRFDGEDWIEEWTGLNGRCTILRGKPDGTIRIEGEGRTHYLSPGDDAEKDSSR